MSALVAAPALPRLAITPRQASQQQPQAGWAPQQRRRLQERSFRRSPAGAPAAYSSSVADLATYHFVQHHAGTASEWFQQAVREVVRHVDEAPVLQTVQLGAEPRTATYAVHDSVVAVPELWQSIAEHVSHGSPDVVILVQRVSPHAAAGSPQGAMDAAQRQQQPGSPPGSPRVQAEEACRRLVSSGVADAILLHGQVGDCCDGSEEHGDDGHTHGGRQQQAAAPPRNPATPSIVPFGPVGGSSRRDVRAAALRPVGAPGAGAASCQQAACYWGVVVQSRRGTGAEGCYLLKTVRSNSGTGCTCTHFSLTRISQGDHLEQQFVQAWLL